MKTIKCIVLVLVIAVGLLLLIGVFLPREFSVSRATLVKAPVALVFDHVNNLEKNEAWSPWKATNPTVQLTYGDPRVGEGASYSWTSERSGEESLTIAQSIPNQTIKTELDFRQMGTATGEWTFKERLEGVEVTWAFAGDAGWDIPRRYINLGIEGMAGPLFEHGLADLKKIVEAAATADPSAGATDGPAQQTDAGSP